MTENEVRQKVVSTAKQYLGYKESDKSHRKIIDTYNAHKPLAQGYKVKYTDSWCATFVSFVAIKCGYTDIMFTECSCPRMVALYKKANRWIENDNYTPKLGDIIMYDWEDSGKGDNKGNPDHVGIVASINGNAMKIIEGNKNDSVSYRDMKVNGKTIRGYCIPDYKLKVTKEESIDAITKIAPAKNFEKNLAGDYLTTSNLNMRIGAGTGNQIITVLPKGCSVSCYGYYNYYMDTKWLCVSYVDKTNKKYTGCVSSKYLKQEGVIA